MAARADTDQAKVARLMREADLLALPTVDHEDRLVGIVTVGRLYPSRVRHSLGRKANIISSRLIVKGGRE